MELAHSAKGWTKKFHNPIKFEENVPNSFLNHIKTKKEIHFEKNDLDPIYHQIENGLDFIDLEKDFQNSSPYQERKIFSNMDRGNRMTIHDKKKRRCCIQRTHCIQTYITYTAMYIVVTRKNHHLDVLCEYKGKH